MKSFGQYLKEDSGISTNPPWDNSVKTRWIDEVRKAYAAGAREMREAAATCSNAMGRNVQDAIRAINVEEE